MQQTIAREITITGVGLHSGANSTITLKPASENTGIMFKRIDIKNTGLIKGTYDNVVDTKNCTCLGDKSGNIISTIEHLMAALAVLQWYHEYFHKTIQLYFPV